MSACRIKMALYGFLNLTSIVACFSIFNLLNAHSNAEVVCQSFAVIQCWQICKPLYAIKEKNWEMQNIIE